MAFDLKDPICVKQKEQDSLATITKKLKFAFVHVLTLQLLGKIPFLTCLLPSHPLIIKPSYETCTKRANKFFR